VTLREELSNPAFYPKGHKSYCEVHYNYNRTHLSIVNKDLMYLVNFIYNYESKEARYRFLDASRLVAYNSYSLNHT